MVAPDACESLLTRPWPATSTVRVCLGATLRPSHLPLFAARDWSGAREQGPTPVLEIGLDPAGCFAALAAGDCDVVVAEPLSLLDATATGIESIGCFFEGRGGVLVRADRLVKLRDGEPVHVATTAAGEPMDRLSRRIIQGWAGARGFAVAETQIVLSPGGPDPVEDLARGFDAVWPASAAAEGVRAGLRHAETVLLSAEDAGLPNFTALELVVSSHAPAAAQARHETLLAMIETAIRRLRAEPARALALWRKIAGEQSRAGEDAGDEAIVAATLPCFRLPIDRRPPRRAALVALLRDG